MNQPKSTVSFEHLPDSAYIRARQLVESVLPFSSTTLWRYCRTGAFPPPVRVSAGVTAWKVKDIRAWLQNPSKFVEQTSNKSEHEVRP
jgi:predicted DNA-binding transcriptional regulator AlpA